MKQLFFLITAVLTLGTVHAQTCNCETLSGNQTSNKTLLSSQCYLLSGCYTIKANSTLTIQAGTRIFAGANSALIVERDADIMASGTSTSPIIFTSNQSAGSRTPGYWDGIYIAGKAVNNVTGGVINLERTCTITGGGQTDNDNSGVFKYVQIHFAQYGLTLLSVGSATELHHVQVTNASADGYQFLGGKVNASHLVSFDVKGNDYTASLGYQGMNQFLLGFRKDVNAHVAAGSYGYLSSNDDAGSSNTPVTRPVVSNMTLIGPAYCSGSTLSTDFRDAIRVKERAASSYYNSVAAYWRQYGLFLEDNSTIAQTASDNLNFSYNSMSNNGSGDYSSDPWSSGCDATMTDWIDPGGFPASCAETGNQFSAITPLGYNNTSICTNTTNPDFALGTTALQSPAFGGISDLNNAFFDNTVTFRGAFGSTDWTNDWTQFNSQSAQYCGQFKMQGSGDQGSLQVMPNPARGLAYAVYASKAPGKAELSVLDKIGGKPLVIKSLVIEAAGTQRIPFDISTLRPGVYIVRLQTGTETLFQQLIVE